MATPDDEINVQLELFPFVQQIFKDVLNELGARLEADLSERDRLAISVAVMKAARRGMLRGMAEFADEVKRAAPEGSTLAEITFSPSPGDKDPDAWADEYGDEQ
jgi:hypothetical protein